MVAVITLMSSSVEDTHSIAAALAGLVSPGDLVLLEGDLGAGKTVFVKGFAAALGVEETVTSPTFALAQRYRGRLVVNHLDVYRLEQLSEVVDLAIPELLDDHSVTLIEWGDVIVQALPGDYLEVEFTFGDEPDDRRLRLSAAGPRWSARSRALRERVADWTVEPC